MKQFFTRPFSALLGWIQHFPVVSFLAVLALFLGLIFLGNLLRQPKVDEETLAAKPPMDVAVLETAADKATYYPIQAKVEANRSIKVLAQQPGVVQMVVADEGTSVKKGQKVVVLASTYSGASAPALQTQLAQTQYNSTVETYGTQKSMIATQRQIAETQAENSEEMLAMTDRSISDTTNVIDLNESLRNSLRDSLEILAQDPETNAAAIGQTRGTIAQLEGGLAQLYAGLRSAKYQADPSSPPQELAKLSREATLKQLELQEKGLDTAKRAAEIQLKLAQLQEALMVPTAPQAGIVERVYVKPGETVAPGAPLYQLRLGNASKSVKLVGFLSSDVAKRVARGEKLMLDNGVVTDYYISEEPTDGFSHVVTGYADEIDASSGEYVTLSLPLMATLENSVLLPIDAVYQTQNGAFVYVVMNDVAEEKVLQLGNVFGGLVEAKGLDASEKVILNRNVTEGSRVRTQ